MHDINLLRAYKLQNPTKYKQKFGDKTPEEIVMPPSRAAIGGVKVEIEDNSHKKIQEVEFEPDPEFKPEPAPQTEPELKPEGDTVKRRPGRPKNAA